MTEDEVSPTVRLMEAREELVQHIEAGRSRVRGLSITTMAVAFLLLASYFYQILTPFASGTRFVQVDLMDPGLLALELLLVALTFAWLYVGAVNYLFANRLGRTIAEARSAESAIEKKMIGQGA